MKVKKRVTSLVTLTTTWDASEKFGPGDLFLFGAGGVEFATPPPLDPFLFRRLFAGLCASLMEFSVVRDFFCCVFFSHNFDNTMNKKCKKIKRCWLW